KNMNNFLDKINREAEAREMDLSENDEYQKYNEYLDLLLNAKKKIKEVPEPIAVERAEVPESYIETIRSFERTERDIQERKAALLPEDKELAVKFNLGEELTEEGVDGAMKAIRTERLGEVTAIDTAHARMAALIYGGDHNKAMRELTELKMKMDIQVATAQKRLFDAEGSLTIQELRGERRVAVDRFARAAREDVQREETPKKPNLFKRLWRKIRPEKNIEVGAVENQSQGVRAREVPEEGLNEKIKNARFEDLKEIANFVERQFPELKLENSGAKNQIDTALKDLEDGDYEKVKRYSEESIGLAQGIEGDISGKEELISFFERIGDIAEEMEIRNKAINIIGDPWSTETTEASRNEAGQYLLNKIFSEDEIDKIKNAENDGNEENLMKMIKNCESRLWKYTGWNITAVKYYHEYLHAIISCYDNNTKKIDLNKFYNNKINAGVKISNERNESIDNYLTTVFEKLNAREEWKNFAKQREEINEEDVQSAVDFIEDPLPIEMTEEVNAEQEQLQEITKEMKRKIKESVKKSIEIEEFNISLIEGFMENYSNSENLFGEDIDEKLFDNIIKEKIGVKFEEIKNIKTKEILIVLKEIFDDIKSEK
ncbi:MAG: hypothetical protein KAS78_04325, partial [Candidatus Pacebacteria bacterium]|nr:hypothetical protein [Candidatus Paceibacterota bacterium]